MFNRIDTQRQNPNNVQTMKISPGSWRKDGIHACYYIPEHHRVRQDQLRRVHRGSCCRAWCFSDQWGRWVEVLQNVRIVRSVFLQRVSIGER